MAQRKPRVGRTTGVKRTRSRNKSGNVARGSRTKTGPNRSSRTKTTTRKRR